LFVDRSLFIVKWLKLTRQLHGWDTFSDLTLLRKVTEGKKTKGKLRTMILDHPMSGVAADDMGRLKMADLS